MLLPPRHSCCAAGDLQVWGEQLPGRYKEPGGLRTEAGAAQDNSIWAAGRREVGREEQLWSWALVVRELRDPVRCNSPKEENILCDGKGFTFFLNT